MDKLFAIIRREYVEKVRSKWFLVMTFLGPVFFAAVVIIPGVLAARTKASSQVANIAVLDASQSPLGERVMTRLKSMPRTDSMSVAASPRLVVVDPAGLAAAETTATKAVLNKSRAGYLVLTDSTLRGETGRYAGRNASSIADVQLLSDAVRQSVLSLRLEKAGLNPDTIRALTTVRVRLNSEVVDERGRGGSGIGAFIVGYIVAFLLYMMIVLYGQSILRGVMEEKTTRVAEVVVASVPSETMLAGKVLGIGAVGITQQIVWIVSGALLIQVREPIMAKFGLANLPFTMPSISAGYLAVVLLFYLLGYIFYAALFAAVGAMVSNQEDAQQAAIPVTMLLVVSILFMQPMLIAPQSTLSRVMSLIPISSPILMPLRMSLVDVPWYEVAASVGLISLACVGSIWVSGRIYRVGLLMYGKRPSLRELVRWVRYAG